MGIDGPTLSIILAAVGGVVWLVRLEGRINSHDREIGDVKDGHSTDIQQIRSDLDYIRKRIDSAIDEHRS